MKKIFSLFAAVLFAGSMLADVVTLDPATQTPQTTETDINLTIQGIGVAYHGTLNAASENNGVTTPADFRVFASQTLKLSSATNKIEKVVIAGKAQKVPFTLSADKGTVTTGSSYAEVTEKATLADPLVVVENIGANSVTLSVTKQMRVYKIEVTLGEASQGGGDPDPVVTPADTLTCAEAAEQALAGKTDEVIIKGYVTEMVEEWSSFKNVSFWMADTKGGENTFEAFRVKCETAAEAPTVGALVWVKGNLTKYTKNDVTIPETKAGGTFGILAKGEEVAPAQNLGAKTISEFLELKNTKDTCILTGIVSNIANAEYGNFDLTDESGTVYVYGLLTADGQSKQFASMGIAAGDTLTCKALYNEYNGAPQAKNAIFVSVKKAPVEMIPVVINEGVVYFDYVADEGWWQISGENEDYYVSLSNGAEVSQVSGTYDIEDLDPEYSYIYVNEGGEYIDLVSGSITMNVDETGVVTALGLVVGSDGNSYDLTIVYYEPEARATVNITADGLAAFDSEEQMAQVIIETEEGLQIVLVMDAEQIAGNYDEGDLYFNYSVVANESEDLYTYIYTATIQIVSAGPDLSSSDGQSGAGKYTMTADLLCYNNVLYHISSILTEASVAVDNTTVASQFLKAIENGTVVIEKNNVRYNVNGQTIR